MRLYMWLLAAVSLLTIVMAEERNPKKRQIYREQVLPHAGGKIPDTAFQTDRLFLNQLQKEGISVPDGIVPQQRNPQVYPFQHKSIRNVYRIALSSDARYTPKVGQYHHKEIPSIETTYLYPQIHGQPVRAPPPSLPAFPVYRQLQLQNPLLNQAKLQPKKNAQLLDVTPSFGDKNHHVKSYRTQSYQNFNILNVPIAPLPEVRSNGYYQLPNYPADNTHLFNEFDDLFNNFNLHQSGKVPAYY